MPMSQSMAPSRVPSANDRRHDSNTGSVTSIVKRSSPMTTSASPNAKSAIANVENDDQLLLLETALEQMEQRLAVQLKKARDMVSTTMSVKDSRVEDLRRRSGTLLQKRAQV